MDIGLRLAIQPSSSLLSSARVAAERRYVASQLVRDQGAAIQDGRREAGEVRGSATASSLSRSRMVSRSGARPVSDLSRRATLVPLAGSSGAGRGLCDGIARREAVCCDRSGYPRVATVSKIARLEPTRYDTKGWPTSSPLFSPSEEAQFSFCFEECDRSTKKKLTTPSARLSVDAAAAATGAAPKYCAPAGGRRGGHLLMSFSSKELETPA